MKSTEILGNDSGSPDKECDLKNCVIQLDFTSVYLQFISKICLQNIQTARKIFLQGKGRGDPSQKKVEGVSLPFTVGHGGLT